MDVRYTKEVRAQAAALEERINRLENEFGQGADIGRREMIVGLKEELVGLRPKRLTEYDLRLVQQIDVRGTDGWYLCRGRIYRPYHGKKDRVFWKDGRLHVQWWSHCDANPIAQARALGSNDPRVLPPVLQRNDADYADVQEWLEEVYGPPSLFVLPWENPEVEYRGFVISVRREESLAGYEMLYYHVMRKRDGAFMVDNFEDSAETVEAMVGYMKARIDAFLALPLKERRDWEDNF